ncbi:V/A-type H+-transporting ATPase subunit C [Aminivibrio pyruvatiphilus]|uniref:V/A-type H+-transporting ATPase subunit C n=1 Tax=Aminivibrio pyruvatiphilus TaxID=1005740 RepID=A0A4R8M8G4_9BACT|nr:V-type ATPase subunit [Aminivibrio pyruvatiphilus]TDY60512.1 V/A-type H+-transporting ATPase subunit C [Aminivibrio pyruvatiphilus]
MIPSQKFTGESPNYEYLNAVVRARGTRLLGREVFFRLASGSLEDMELFLLESRYGQRYREQLATGGGSLLGRIENALAGGAADILQETASLARGESLLFFSVILSLGDLHNGRILLRASPGGIRPGNSPAWHRYSLADPSFYDDLWKKCPTPADGAVRCHEENHDFARILGESYRVLHETGDLFRAERALYSGWFSRWRERIRGKNNENGRRMAEYLGRLTDLWNFSIWLRPGEETAGERAFLPGGWGFSQEALETLDDPHKLFSGSGWSFVPGKHGEKTRSDLFRSFQRHFYEWQTSLYRKNLLGADVSLGYAAQVVQEWKNLSLLAVGLSLRMPAAELERHLFLPGEGHHG